MPISHSHKFIYIHIGKIAGSSMMQAFAEAGVTFDPISSATFLDVIANRPDRDYLFGRWRKLFPLHGTEYPIQHLQAFLLKPLIPPEIWDSYYKFSFVRNPWDFMVSTYFYVQQIIDLVKQSHPVVYEIVLGKSFKEFLTEAWPKIKTDYKSFLTDDNGRVLLDYIGRHERLDDDYAFLCARLGIPHKALPHANVSEHENYRQYYDEETIEIVRRSFATEIEMFGYEF
ncbi:MAG TPA: sulfotransferase family 2 domain-containing protein [Candidatus Binatia bacterium]|nr:sulfotransferase family 2 domain-containing protein [Candidatus Binatia bacterium]